ncbi:hypothetical protein FOMPIDRAFT_153231 [Fomitopsis schrenkii]|uniref:Uncharacterized protein n=1 Tax=Fomitopsis schrenkii TaxID=2126942 RepID=S8FWC1_FOMSC|nr:hypothetical protein FOMPIDRAFT_153231 [Fomitopsis schrenkii]
MKEEDIVDHGIPTFPQGTKLLADLDLLNLNPYLMGVLRQLVGVDMLREQEIFYLPQEGEQYAWKPKRHHKHTAPKTKLSARARKSIGAPIQSAPDSHGHAESVSAAPSRAGSVSTVSSRQSRKSRASTRGSTANSASVAGSEYSDGSDVEDDDDSVRSTKRRRTEIAVSPPVENGGDTEAPVPKVSATASKKIGPMKRTRKIGKDASAYKPDPTDEQGSSDEEPTSRRTRRKTKRGTKRPRADEAAEETVVGIAPPKRRRVRQKPAEANGEEK